MIQNSPKTNMGLEPGALFRRSVGGSMIEIAEILDSGKDRMGIPHIRFKVHLMRGTYAASAAEQRTLSLESFCARYRERVLSA